MKECGICGLRVESAKAEEHFYKSKRTKDGFEKNCKECKVALAREKRQAKKSKLEKNQKKKSAASPEKAVAEVVKTDTIKKNDYPVDLDEMVKQIFTAAGYSNLLDGLKQAAFIDMRPLYMETIFLALCQLEERGIEK